MRCSVSTLIISNSYLFSNEKCKIKSHIPENLRENLINFSFQVMLIQLQVFSIESQTVFKNSCKRKIMLTFFFTPFTVTKS